MKAKNARPGIEVQIKRDCKTLCCFHLEKGAVYPVICNDTQDDTVNLRIPIAGGGYGWVKAEDIRRFR